MDRARSVVRAVARAAGDMEHLTMSRVSRPSVEGCTVTETGQTVPINVTVLCVIGRVEILVDIDRRTGNGYLHVGRRGQAAVGSDPVTGEADIGKEEVKRSISLVTRRSDQPTTVRTKIRCVAVTEICERDAQLVPATTKVRRTRIGRCIDHNRTVSATDQFHLDRSVG